MQQKHKIIELIDAYWKFDDNQHPQSSWHEKQELLKKVEKELSQHDIGTIFTLTKSEKKLFDESGSKEIRFSFGGGIGISVSYKNSSKKWIDITDYSNW